jgi:hypothetical protein
MTPRSQRASVSASTTYLVNSNAWADWLVPERPAAEGGTHDSLLRSVDEALCSSIRVVKLQVDVPDELVDLLVELVLARLPDAHRQRLLPIPEAASVLGLTEAALRKHAQRGNVPIVRIGSRVLVDMGELS